MQLTKGIDYLKKTLGFLARTLLIVLVIRYCLINPGRVHGPSMEPTFYTGDYFLVNRMAYLYFKPERFDVVQLIDPTDTEKLLIKRVIGLPGDTVTFEVDGTVSITPDGGLKVYLSEAYLAPGIVTHPRVHKFSEIVVPPNSYYVLGDNRLASHDSRDIEAVPRKYINGEIIPITHVEPTASQLSAVQVVD